jgi:uncharacterized protein YutE (UPF0331/DUF86 family)
MTFLVERLAELRRHVDHLAAIRGRIHGPESLQTDLSLHNDVLFSLLTICQHVIDIAGELAARDGIKFQDYAGAIRALARQPGMPAGLSEDLLPLAGFRNVLIHEYVELDFSRVIAAVDHLDPVHRLISAVAALERA